VSVSGRIKESKSLPTTKVTEPLHLTSPSLITKD